MTQLSGELPYDGKRGKLRSMRVLLAAVVLACLGGQVAAEPPPAVDWRPLSKLYYNPGQVRLYGSGDDYSRNCLAVICNGIYVVTRVSSSGYGNFGQQQVKTPTTVDFTGPPYNLPANAHGVVFVTGMLIITNPSETENVSINMTAAAYGSTIDCNIYMGQTAQARFGGQRSNHSFWWPIKDGKGVFCYDITVNGAPVPANYTYPEHASFGLNFTVQLWAEEEAP